MTNAREGRLPAILPGRAIGIGFKTSPQGVDWATLDATWEAAGELDAFDCGWMNDHLVHPTEGRSHPSFEALTVAAALAHHVPGRWIGHAVLANTFRHPSVVAKAVTALDHVTGGRFVVGLGAGWVEAEHEPFGIPLPPIGERVDRMISATRVLRAMFSPEAATPPGVSLDDPYYPLRGATNVPAPLRPGGPPVWLGGQKRRGLRLAASLGDGWLLPGDRAGDVDYFVEKRDALRRELDAAGRSSAPFAIVGQVAVTGERATLRDGLETAVALVRAGATHVIVGIPAAGGPDVLRAAAREVAEPLREVVG